MVADSYEESQSVIADSNTNGPADIQRYDADAEAENLLPLSPVSQTRQVLEMVEGLAYGCDVPVAMHFRRKAKEAFLKGKKSATLDYRSQKSITEMLK